MKLVDVLNNLGLLEKNPFIKIIDNIITAKPKNFNQIEKKRKEFDGELKKADDMYISDIFNLLGDEFSKNIENEFSNISSQLDIFTDIMIRDGNCLMSSYWFYNLYEKEIKKTNEKIKGMNEMIKNDNKELDPWRLRDYRVYKACVSNAYHNDEENNQTAKITSNEQTILNTLSEKLGLSKEEIRLINYSVLELKKRGKREDIIRDLKNIGIIFYSKKQDTIFIPDEFVSLLRKIRGKELADKHFRRVLKHLKSSQINLIAKKHNIDRKLSLEEKIDQIIDEGVRFTDVLLHDIFKDGVKLTEKKSSLNDLIQKELKIDLQFKGITAEDKVKNLIDYFNHLDKRETLSISTNGYEKLLRDINKNQPDCNKKVKSTFELQDDDVLRSEYLLKYNVKPRDILYLMSDEQLKQFCKANKISTRGDTISNIIESYKDAENLDIENYVNFARRDKRALEEYEIKIRDELIGIKFEELTKKIFEKLGFNVDEKLRKQLSTKKDKIDIILRLDNDEIIIVECKTKKDKDFNNYSSVSRQIKSYIELAKKEGHTVRKSLLIAPEFSDTFEADCVRSDIELSLINASTLKKILDEFKKYGNKQFPFTLLYKDTLINEDIIIKVLKS